MSDEPTQRAEETHDPDAIARAHAIYTPFMLAFYDVIVHGLSNRFAWRCATRELLGLYETSLSTNHLEAGVGTGFFIDRTGKTAFDRLVLLDINPHCLDRAARRLTRFKPELLQASLLDPIEPRVAPFDSVGLTYVLHCLPGRMRDKLRVVDHLRPLLREQAMLFGATILGCRIAPNRAARALLNLYNAKGVFNNREDDLASLSEGLRRRFDYVVVEQHGCVATFRAA